MGLCLCFLDSKLLDRMLNDYKGFDRTTNNAYDRPMDYFLLGLQPQNPRNLTTVNLHPRLILLRLEVNKHGALDFLPSFSLVHSQAVKIGLNKTGTHSSLALGLLCNVMLIYNFLNTYNL